MEQFHSFCHSTTTGWPKNYLTKELLINNLFVVQIYVSQYVKLSHSAVSFAVTNENLF
jgi:hypothetical protein